ncbi:hypothetical protein LEP1GSC168_1454 [Leptospira santarosai str. HAI134]|uniref:Uncharacterized protein n=1 Tax=Leptospira santarosai str. MOR084 TaxID=1049984 RepID=A0A0E2BDE4_9LEPT|nr:hypothetical protein LEP1GSC179_2602 [Leptospira santarosai str. MOR084]EMO21703.1 hypothetical protein LEP1GSC168_1454 [Leptospira santarosai str. HAI134]
MNVRKETIQIACLTSNTKALVKTENQTRRNSDPEIHPKVKIGRD